ncbi:MAG: hypothetical protein HC940_04545 [Acaryochloris sp. SU_5_25]|nr:hypothetical protein [Acaryochloris sp. SU_5_25]
MNKFSQKLAVCLAMICISIPACIETLSAAPAQLDEQSRSLEDRVSELSQQIISAINEVEVTGDFKSAAQKRKIDGVNLTPILKRIERRKAAHDFLKSKGKAYKILRVSSFFRMFQ